MSVSIPTLRLSVTRAVETNSHTNASSGINVDTAARHKQKLHVPIDLYYCKRLTEIELVLARS